MSDKCSKDFGRSSNQYNPKEEGEEDIDNPLEDFSPILFDSSISCSGRLKTPRRHNFASSDEDKFANTINELNSKMATFSGGGSDSSFIMKRRKSKEKRHILYENGEHLARYNCDSITTVVTNEPNEITSEYVKSISTVGENVKRRNRSKTSVRINRSSDEDIPLANIRKDRHEFDKFEERSVLPKFGTKNKSHLSANNEQCKLSKASIQPEYDKENLVFDNILNESVVSGVSLSPCVASQSSKSKKKLRKNSLSRNSQTESSTITNPQLSKRNDTCNLNAATDEGVGKSGKDNPRDTRKCYKFSSSGREFPNSKRNSLFVKR